MLVSGELPNRVNVSKQILLKQQLSAHYKKLQGAKASVDTSTPYSFSNNPTTRGYQPKNHRLTNKSCLNDISEGNDATFEMPTKFSDDHTVDSIVKEFLKNNPIFHNVGHEEGNIQGDGSAVVKLSSRFNRSVAGSTRLSYSARPGSSSGDVLEKHQHKFTPEKPFSPRTVKTNAESKLRRLRCYNPPIKATRIVCSGKYTSETKPVRPASVNEVKHSSNVYPSRPKSVQLVRSGSRSFQPVVFRHVRNSIQSAGNVSQSPRPKRQQASPSPTQQVNRSPCLKSHQTLVKPNLVAIDLVKTAVEEDDEKEEEVNAPPIGKVNRWLRTFPDSESSFHPTDSTEDMYSLSPDSRTTQHPEGQINVDSEQRLNVGAKHTEPDPNQSHIGYLNFIEAVTNDILSRGVFTDRNLNWLLLEHANRNEYGLTDDELKQATDQLRNQLKITDDSIPPTAIHRVSSESLTGAGGTSSDWQLPLRTSPSGEPGTETGGHAHSSGATVPAKLVLTSMRPPPAPSRAGSSPTVHRLGSAAGNRMSHMRKTTPPEPSKEQEEQNKKQVVTNQYRNPSSKVGDNQISLGLLEPSGVPGPSSEKLTPSFDKDGSTQPADSSARDNSTEYNLLANCATADREDTLNDQTTIPNSASDFPEASSPETRTGTPHSDDLLTDCGISSGPIGTGPHKSESDPDQVVVRPTRVKFAPEPEFFSVKQTSDLTTSATTLTDLTHLSSGEAELSSQQDAEPDLSSVQAIAEGDSNISFEIHTQKDCSLITHADDLLPYRAKV